MYLRTLYIAILLGILSLRPVILLADAREEVVSKPGLGTESSSIEKQRLSVRKQVRAAGSASEFFLTPWMNAPVVTAASPVAQANGDCDPLPQSTLHPLVLEASQKEGVRPDLVRALIKRESGGKPCATSAKGAQGLMQLMPATQLDLGISDPFDATANITAGVRYLKQMLDRYEGNTALALAAYNAGPQRVSPGGKVPDIAETQAYVTGILGDLNQEDAPPNSALVK